VLDVLRHRSRTGKSYCRMRSDVGSERFNTYVSHKRSTQICKILNENMHDHNVEKYDFPDAIQRSPMDRPSPLHHLLANTQPSPNILPHILSSSSSQFSNTPSYGTDHEITSATNKCNDPVDIGQRQTGGWKNSSRQRGGCLKFHHPYHQWNL
jgi:hypothetical protein